VILLCAVRCRRQSGMLARLGSGFCSLRIRSGPAGATEFDFRISARAAGPKAEAAVIA